MEKVFEKSSSAALKKLSKITVSVSKTVPLFLLAGLKALLLSALPLAEGLSCTESFRCSMFNLLMKLHRLSLSSVYGYES